MRLHKRLALAGATALTSIPVSLSSKFWRVQATSHVWIPSGGNSQYTISIAELLLFESSDLSGVNVAASSFGSVPTASSSHSAFPISRLNDSDAGSFWVSSSSAPSLQWAQVSLATAKDIHSASITWLTYSGTNTMPKTFDLQKSRDGGVTWITVYSGTTPNIAVVDGYYTNTFSF